jgi:hypothetical protein
MHHPNAQAWCTGTAHGRFQSRYVRIAAIAKTNQKQNETKKKRSTFFLHALLLWYLLPIKVYLWGGLLVLIVFCFCFLVSYGCYGDAIRHDDVIHQAYGHLSVILAGSLKSSGMLW